MSAFALSQDEKKQLRGTMFGGAFSGALARVLLHPIDTCKAKLQVQPINGKDAHGGTAFKNTWSVMRHTWRTQQFRGLYAGFGCVGHAKSL